MHNKDALETKRAPLAPNVLNCTETMHERPPMHEGLHRLHRIVLPLHRLETVVSLFDRAGSPEPEHMHEKSHDILEGPAPGVVMCSYASLVHFQGSLCSISSSVSDSSSLNSKTPTQRISAFWERLKQDAGAGPYPR